MNFVVINVKLELFLKMFQFKDFQRKETAKGSEKR